MEGEGGRRTPGANGRVHTVYVNGFRFPLFQCSLGCSQNKSTGLPTPHPLVTERVKIIQAARIQQRGVFLSLYSRIFLVPHAFFS